MFKKRQSGIWLRLQPTVIKYTAGLTAGQLATIEIIKDPHKDDFNNFVADLSNNVRERFLTSLNNDKTNAVINLGYLLVSQTILFSNQLSLSQMESSRVGQTSPPSLS